MTTYWEESDLHTWEAWALIFMSFLDHWCYICSLTIKIGQGKSNSCHRGLTWCEHYLPSPHYFREILSNLMVKINYPYPCQHSTSFHWLQGFWHKEPKVTRWQQYTPISIQPLTTVSRMAKIRVSGWGNTNSPDKSLGVRLIRTIHMVTT